MSRSASRRTRAPRTAEIIAGQLRDAIVRGELTVLPRLEDLIERFQAGPPAVREAMRILETEGLITIRRGNVGGADAHLPTADRVAYMVSLVLQSKSTNLGDVGEALRALEPLCASMCAARPDRNRTVVPELKRIVAEQADAIGDVPRTLGIVDRFHDTIVQGCGNDTLVLMVGALERVWAGHANAVYAGDDAPEPPPTTWKTSLRDHDRIVAMIERGDAKVDDLVRRHLEATQAYMSSVDDTCMVTAAATIANRSLAFG
ncbi:MAG: pdhR 2 [Actinomycetia bacterium]|jgi:GntR family transcriptional repressor for pyruvate dehydrogenase complex|nr:pdhR 2 [Actinomycetes bacterium]